VNAATLNKPLRFGQDLKGSNILSTAILRTLQLHGPKSTRQLTELLSCENVYGELGSPYSLNADILSTIKNLYLSDLAISYDSKTGMWYSKTQAHLGEINLVKSNFAEIDLNKVKFKEIGFGQEYVYALYLPGLRYSAALNDWKLYPIKIGRTKNLLNRISALSFTGPGMLVPGVVLRTDNSQILEKELHRTLSANQAQINLSGRREWFRSNMANIEYLFTNLAKKGVI
jgi:hypothetical protein